jgi:hypothetical protein
MTEHEQISIPATQVENSKDNPYRLCEYDTESQKGCRRTNTIFALEAEFDTFVDPEMEWGVWDFYCRHEGKTYYYKEWLSSIFATDAEVRVADTANTNFVDAATAIGNFLGRPYVPQEITLDSIRSLIANPPKGFPQFVIETPQFFQFDDIGQKINIDILSKTLLDKIKNTFTDDVNPLLRDLSNRIFLKDDKIICTDITVFENNPNTKLGIIIVPTESEKYDVTKAYFFAFSPLTPEQIIFATNITALEAGFERAVEIINL